MNLPFDPYVPVGPSANDLAESAPVGATALAPELRRDRGDALTFDEVFEGHAGYVWRVLRRLGVRNADLKDVCQEVFIVVHGKLPSYDGRCSVTTWLWGLCRRKASEYRRTPHVGREDLVDALPEQGEPPSQELDMDQRAKLRLLDAALATLDDDKRLVFVLHGIEEVPMREVAEICDCPLQTAYSRYHAAQRHVEAALRRLSRTPQ
jgi:RNA polymerase sigma-70 factor (ECF subfamily)